jgi:hypothetical protein
MTKGRTSVVKNDEIKNLALELLRADSESEVISLLRAASLWEDPAVWRLYGDKETNYATIGNQQSRPEAALVEKIVNSVDARLLCECLRRGIDPQSHEAPPSIRHAVARFFENREPKGDVGGLLLDWPQPRQLEEAQKITIAVTGPTAKAGKPSLTIADAGEGQMPSRMPHTFLSLVEKSNKLRIPFVQGKFNMGGTGVLKFCGENSLELILSRRDPEIVSRLKEKDPTASQWGFTIVRRERPKPEVGQVKNSVFRYLAPVGADREPGKGQVFSFSSDKLEVFPDKNQAYARAVRHGSVIKLYEYDIKGKSHALMGDGLLSRLELLLPEIALPVRVHECRKYKGDAARSFANSLVGLTARLTDNRAANLESSYPSSVPFSVRGESMVARIYAFKEDKAESYRSNEGIIFTINGQTHGSIPKTFFDRSRVRMGRLAKSLLVVVDCSQLSVGAREDLFMNSRDRLSNGELRKAIEEELEDIIAKHPGLRELREGRRNQEIEGRLKDSKPLEDVLGSILKSSPSLARLFLQGTRLSRPHRAGTNGSQPGSGGSEGGSGPFVGRPHPTFFRFHHKKVGEVMQRGCEIGRRTRIKFETDVENEYFSRSSQPGRYHIEVLEGTLEGKQLDHNLTLHNGVANWSVTVPEDLVREGDELTLECTVTDDTLVEPFTNVARLRILKKSDREASGGERSGRRGDTEEKGNTEGESEPGGLALPDIIKVRAGDPNYVKHKFEDLTACKVVEDASGNEEEERSVYTFYVNVDNRFLRTDMKEGKDDVNTREAKFVYGNVLVGLGLIHDYRSRNGKPAQDENDAEETTIPAIVDRTTRALGPFLVPMIDYLGALSSEELANLGQIGDDE